MKEQVHGQVEPLKEITNVWASVGWWNLSFKIEPVAVGLHSGRGRDSYWLSVLHSTRF